MSRGRTTAWGICGCGSAGGALAAALAGDRAEILVWDRRASRARYLARRPGVRSTGSLRRLLAESRTLLLAISDGAIADFAPSLARRMPQQGLPPTVLHLAGALDASVLAPLTRKGGTATGVFHPVVALRGPRSAAAFAGGSVTLSGASAAIAAGRRLARRLGMHAIVVAGDQRPLIHLAAVMAAGDLVALAGLAESLLLRAGIESAAGRRLLAHLARSALAHWEREGLGRAGTGPAARGDIATLETPLAARHQTAAP